MYISATNREDIVRKHFRSYTSALNISLFDRRTESIAWLNNDCLLASSHGGDIVSLNGIENVDEHPIRSRTIRKGSGKGGAVIHMLPIDKNTVILSSHDCKLTQSSIEDGIEYELANTGDYDHWFTCSGYSYIHSCLVATDNRGAAHIFDSRTAKAAVVYSLHRSNKISFIDFHVEGHVFATGSNDKTCRVFDLRAISTQDAPSRRELAIYNHGGVVSSCNFSSLRPSALLTTAQNDELRVFDVSMAGELASPRVVIPHSHRFYQHITTIKASWHPICKDLICCGRYDSGRGIDMIDVSKPQTREWNISSPGVDTILCTNIFSPNGSKLASGTSSSVALWKLFTSSRIKERELVKVQTASSTDLRASAAIRAQDDALHKCSSSVGPRMIVREGLSSQPLQSAEPALTEGGGSVELGSHELSTPASIDFSSFRFK